MACYAPPALCWAGLIFSLGLAPVVTADRSFESASVGTEAAETSAAVVADAERDSAEADPGSADPAPAQSRRGADPLLEPVAARGVEFDGVSGELLSLETLQGLQIHLTASKRGYIPAPPNVGVRAYRLDKLTTEQGQPLELNPQALNAITVLVSQAYIEAGFAAVRVTIRRDALDRLRQPDSDALLRVRVVEGRVAGLRSRSASTGEETTAAAQFDLRRHSSLQAGDAVNVRAANRYLAFLNRHPRRRVDLTLAPADDDGQVMLDYLVHQAKPWTLYAQVSNTGTPQTTQWREQVGLLHTNLLDHDDILAVSYVTGDLRSTHAASVSYDRPFDADPRWRWRAFGDWSRYDASELGITGAEFMGESWGGGGEIKWNFLQYKDVFVDAVGGLQYRTTQTANALAGLDGDAEFLLPYAGLQFDRQTINTRATARATLETNLRGLTGSGDDDVQALGRTDADSDWVALRWGGSFSRFIDSWFYGPSESLEKPSQIHEIDASVRGQLIFGEQRVAPSFTSAVGGFNSVRGYPEVFDSGDNSAVASLEYRYHLPRGLESVARVPTAGDPRFRGRPAYAGGRTDWDLIFRGFVDAGHVWSNDPLSFEGSSTLVGAGVGVELLLKQNLSLRADWGFALREETSGDQTVTPGSSQVHLQFTLLY